MDYQINLPPHVRTLMKRFSDEGFLIYPVGGCVRDALLGKKISDWDFTTNATPDEMLVFLPEGKCENNFGTVLVPSEDGVFEITPFRTESMYTNNRHPSEVTWAQTLEEDVQRRDFTMNALAYDVQNATIIDLVNGVDDINNQIIRTVGNPYERFQEDALRMLRAIRFSAQLGFTLDPRTLQAIHDEAGRIQSISWERIRDEMTKLICSPYVSLRTFDMLRSTGLLAYILPELDVCFGVEQKSPNRHHTTDVATHLVNTLIHCPTTKPHVRWAALLHDIGKASTRLVDAQGVTTFHNHEIVGASLAEDIAHRLRMSRHDREAIVKLVRYHMFTVEDTQTDKAVRRFIRRIGKDLIQDMLDLRTADRLGSGTRETSWRTELFKKRILEVQEEPFEIRDLAIKGDFVMKTCGLQPGPKVGEILAQLFDDVIEGRVQNTQEALEKRLDEITS